MANTINNYGLYSGNPQTAEGAHKIQRLIDTFIADMLKVREQYSKAGAKDTVVREVIATEVFNKLLSSY